MVSDPPLVRCPACGSALTSPREDLEIWECWYCSAVFPVESPLRACETLLPFLTTNEPSTGVGRDGGDHVN